MEGATIKPKYIRPKCCGNGLTLFTDIYVAVAVRENGKPSLHRPQMFDYDPNKLFCLVCKAKYYVSKDGLGRVVKGERIADNPELLTGGKADGGDTN